MPDRRRHELIAAEQADPSGAFSCVASIGGGEGVEIQMSAMQAAISNELNDPGGCNEGFLRDDAILVITVLTDENDGSDGDPPDWYDAVVTAKGGNEEATVVRDSDVDGGLCESGAAVRMREFAELFTYGQWGSVCQKSYGEMFVEAVSTIDTSCEGFDPEG